MGLGGARFTWRRAVAALGTYRCLYRCMGRRRPIYGPAALIHAHSTNSLTNIPTPHTHTHPTHTHTSNTHTLQVSGDYSLLSDMDAEDAPAPLMYTELAEDSHLFRCVAVCTVWLCACVCVCVAVCGCAWLCAHVCAQTKPAKHGPPDAPPLPPHCAPAARSLPPSVVRDLQELPIAMENHMHGAHARRVRGACPLTRQRRPPAPRPAAAPAALMRGLSSGGFYEV